VRRAVFLDRDGVLNGLVADPRSGLPESPLHPDEVSLLPGAAAAAARLSEAGFALVGVSNQPAAAKGTVTLTELEAVQATVLELLSAAGVSFDGFEICWHHPDGVVKELAAVCPCRKPAPGMLRRAAAELELDLGSSWIVGDSDADVLAGRAAGTRTILIEAPGSAHRRSGSVVPDATAADLAAAAAVIVGS
jgi:D-glycero-D-manno-heptose 1,7-bisphosphate phosphatase